VNRSETPWPIVLMHAPCYNSYNYHYMEGESMRVMYEPWFVKYKVDLVFAGHVHAYERTVPISSSNELDQLALHANFLGRCKSGD
jgi:acid phosphatase type 7